MKFLRLTTVYPAYLAGFYAAHPGLEKQSYSEQYRSIAHDAFGWADFWSHAMAPLGYEVWEPIANAEAMQRAWAMENGGGLGGSDWPHALSLMQARSFAPDVVFIDDYGAFDGAFVRSLREAAPSIRLVLGWCAAPYHDEGVFSHYDVVLTSIPGAADFFRGRGFRSEVVQHAFDPRILTRLDLNRPKQHPLTFLGSVRPGAAHLDERQALLLELSREAGLEVFADVAVPAQTTPGGGGLLSRMRRWLGASHGDQAGVARATASDWQQFAARTHPAKFGLDMFQALRDSTVTVNAHSGFFGDWASNMRLYEATGVGTCLLTDAKQNLDELFRPDQEVVVYSSVEDCLVKVRWLADHPADRDLIAQAGQRRTLNDHTFTRRAESLDAIIRRSLTASRSP